MKIKEEKIYTVLCCLFTVLIITSNLIYQKFVQLPILPFYKFELSSGAILYPVTFLITDLIAEFYGKENARFCVNLAILISLAVNLFIIFVDKLNATAWSLINNDTFHKVFGLYGIAFFSSLIASYAAQVTDITLYLWIRKLTKGKFLWLRNNVSMSISLLLDTSIVIGAMVFLGSIPVEQMLPLILNSYVYKLFFVICSTPLFYLAVRLLKHFIKDGSEGL